MLYKVVIQKILGYLPKENIVLYQTVNKDFYRWINEMDPKFADCNVNVSVLVGYADGYYLTKYIKFRSEKTFAYAAENGNLENMKWLKEEGCSWDSWTFVNAAKNGKYEMVKRTWMSVGRIYIFICS